MIFFPTSQTTTPHSLSRQPRPQPPRVAPISPPVPPPPEVPSLPSMTEMAKNVTASLANMVKTAVKGQSVRLGKEEADRRLDICKMCQFFRHTDQRCSKCGCFMAVKTYLRAERCPVGKW